LIDYYDAQGVVVRIDGAQQPEETFADIVAALGHGR
jgi:adenylate kinase family enzyme